MVMLFGWLAVTERMMGHDKVSFSLRLLSTRFSFFPIFSVVLNQFLCFCQLAKLALTPNAVGE